jgi:hypothetical protein
MADRGTPQLHLSYHKSTRLPDSLGALVKTAGTSEAPLANQNKLTAHALSRALRRLKEHGLVQLVLTPKAHVTLSRTACPA